MSALGKAAPADHGEMPGGRLQKVVHLQWYRAAGVLPGPFPWIRRAADNSP
jgi:hypothetical protein